MSKYHIETEIALAKQWAELRLKDYIEPTREGSRRGDPIGLSKVKMFAAQLMPLHPAVSLKILAGKAGISNGVLKVWRTQPAFKQAMEKAAMDLGCDMAANFMHFRETSYSFSDAQRSEDARNELDKADDIIGFVSILNETARIFFWDEIQEWVDKTSNHSSVGKVVYFEIYDRFKQYIAMREGSLKEYARKSDSVKITKKLVSLILTMITVETDQFKRKEYADRLREMVSDYIDLLK